MRDLSSGWESDGNYSEQNARLIKHVHGDDIVEGHGTIMAEMYDICVFHEIHSVFKRYKFWRCEEIPFMTNSPSLEDDDVLCRSENNTDDDTDMNS